MCNWAYLRGNIEKGDFKKVRGFYQKNQKILNVLQLDSPGGDVAEALLIGKLLRRDLITAQAPERSVSSIYPSGELRYLGAEENLLCKGSECICASACALIWFGGVERRGAVGLHRPRIDDPAFKALPPAEAFKVYRRVLDAACGPFTAQEEETYWSVAAKEEGRRTASETVLYNLLSEKKTANNACKMKWRYSHAEQIAPP
jgi:hypothetical protein